LSCLTSSQINSSLQHFHIPINRQGHAIPYPPTDRAPHQCPAVCTLNGFAVKNQALIGSENPDPIVTGCSVHGDLNEVSADLLVDSLDRSNVPYTFTSDNQDSKKLAHVDGSGVNSIFDRGPSSIHGFSNSTINLVN
jgi:hypothetical protein